jgi:hypothetical protein
LADIDFRVAGVRAAPHSAAPLLNFHLLLCSDRPIHALTLCCQVRIEPARRRYSEAEQRRLRDLFGAPERWSQTLRSLLWTNASVVVPPFSESVGVDLPVPCTFDFNVASTKYFHGIEEGEVPLVMLFSGTIFYEGPEDAIRVAQIPWSKEAAYGMPVRAWKEMMDAYYPNTAWLCLRRDVFDRLHQYKIDRGIPTWEQTVESILP